MKKLLIALLFIGCASPCMPGYATLYANGATLKTNYYPAIAIGDYGDQWESTSGNKVFDVLVAGEGRPPEYDPDDSNHFIYLWSDTLPEQVKILIGLGIYILHSDTLNAPEYPSMRTVEFVSDTMPGGGDWTIAGFNALQIGAADYRFQFIQSYKCRGLPLTWPPITWDIQSAGVRAVIQFGADLDQIQIRVLKIEKVLNYYD